MLRPLWLGLLSVLIAAPALAVTPMVSKPVVVVFPMVGSSDAELQLGLGIADRAAAELLGTNKVHQFHVKQVLSMLGHHRVAPEAVGTAQVAEEGAKILGAEVGVFGRLRGDSLEVELFDLRKNQRASHRVTLPKGAAAAVRDGGRAIAKHVLALAGQSGELPAAAQPDSKSDAAMESYLACFRVLVRQPMGQRES